MDEDTIWFIFWVTFSILLSVGPWAISLVWGYFYQRSKKEKLLQREINSARDPLTNLKVPSKDNPVKFSQLIWANVVMSPSWFQLLIAGIYKLIGGNVNTLTGIFDWARREVLQRLREKAWDEGFDDVINLRIETSMISKNNDKQASMEIVAYGTGIKY